MNYEQKYKKALEKARQLCAYPTTKPFISDLQDLFPELNESEDKQIRKELIDYLKERKSGESYGQYVLRYDRWINLLEKQDESDETKAKEFLINKGYPIDTNDTFPTYEEMYNIIRDGLEQQSEQNHDDKVESKFKVGNWYQCTKDFFGKGVTFDKNTAYYCAKEGCLQDEYGCHIAIVKNLYDNFKLWTIDDAKDGDVLCTYECGEPKIVFILKGIPRKDYTLSYYYYYNLMYPYFDSYVEKGCLAPNEEDVKPATKEQRDLLFQKMKESGYGWDDNKKESIKL